MLGHNNPPTDEELLREKHSDMVSRTDELLEGADRAPSDCQDKETADKLTAFLKQIAAHSKACEATRKTEKEPYLQAGKIVQEFFGTMTGELKIARDTVQKPLTAYQVRIEKEAQAKAAEERKIAEEAARVAQEAARAAEEANKPLEQERAQKASDMARLEASKAKDAETAKAPVKSSLGGTAGLVKFWDFEIEDPEKIDLQTLLRYLPADAIERAIRAYIKVGGRELGGVKIFENHRTTIR